ncbi:hypothetical protein KC726_02855 [Candidatus Woesebacteria bacterium]|nr:hypothetical protein [Candidatus Woesebacteria bacterium]
MSLTTQNKRRLNQWLSDESFYSPSLLNNEKKIIIQARKNALSLFHAAAKRVPAYKDFLHKNGIQPATITTIEDFCHVPVTTKENYIIQYDIKSRTWDGSFKDVTIISTSSGTTGDPHLWPRNLSHEIDGAHAHELIFRDTFGLKNKSVLFINGFALGNWIAGTFTQMAVQLVAWKGYNVTLMSPGYVLEEVLSVVRQNKDAFDEIIISGHIPFLKEVVEVIKEQALIGKANVRLLGTGQAITERLRDHLGEQLGNRNQETIVNLYGSADAALMGWESALTINMRKVMSKNVKLKEIIVKKNRLPALFVFDPRLTFIEAVDGELHITKDAGCPLVRYNIHDEGGVVGYSTMIKHFDFTSFPDFKNNLSNAWKLPFVYLFGRDKFMVKIYGANIYSEHVDHVLNHESLQEYITGRFTMEVVDDDAGNSLFLCHVELMRKQEPDKSLTSLIRETFVRELIAINKEYEYVSNHVGEKTHPKIMLYKHGDPKKFPRKKVIKNA